MRLVILQGISGSGKSTWAQKTREELMSQGKTVEICSADDYWGEDYNFNPRNLPRAHQVCQQKAVKAMANRVGVIIIDNTNIKERDTRFYAEEAKKYGYTVWQVVFDDPLEECKARNASRPPHRRIPDHVLERQSREMEFLPYPYFC